MLNLNSKSIIAIVLTFTASFSFAAETTNPTAKPRVAAKDPSQQCGIFEVTGYLKKVGKNYSITLAPGSRSEAQIILTEPALSDAKNPVTLPAHQSFITAKIQMNSPMMHYRGSAQKISDVTLAVPNEMRGDKGTGLKLLEPKSCIFEAM